jgi:transcriptional regulator with XRE-family HTH domain
MSISRDVGKKIREIRDFRKISVEELAERSKLNVDLLMQIEEHNNVPSLAPLIRIARVLGVRLGTFLDDAFVLGPVISRAENRKSGFSFSGQTSNRHKHMEFFPLAGDKSARHMEPFIIEILPAQDNDYLLSTHEGEEFIYVLSGKIEIIYGQDTYQLGEGDSIYYDSVVEHHVHAAPGSGAKILAVVYSPY